MMNNYNNYNILTQQKMEETLLRHIVVVLVFAVVFVHFFVGTICIRKYIIKL